MRRWFAIFVLVVVPMLNGCCCNHGCGYRLFCRPCMFGGCGCLRGGCGGGYSDGGCSSCYGGAPMAGPPMTGSPMIGTPAPPTAGPMMGTPQIEKLSAANVPTRVMR